MNNSGKTALAFLLAVIISAAGGGYGIGYAITRNLNPVDWFKEKTTADGLIVNLAEISKEISATIMPLNENESETSSTLPTQYKVHLGISPEGSEATNFKWNAKFFNENSEWAQYKKTRDYIGLSAERGTEITITNYAAFSEPIIITAEFVENTEIKASLQCDFVKKLIDVEITPPNVTGDNKWGQYWDEDITEDTFGVTPIFSDGTLTGNFKLLGGALVMDKAAEDYFFDSQYQANKYYSQFESKTQNHFSFANGEHSLAGYHEWSESGNADFAWGNYCILSSDYAGWANLLNSNRIYFETALYCVSQEYGNFLSLAIDYEYNYIGKSGDELLKTHGTAYGEKFAPDKDMLLLTSDVDSITFPNKPDNGYIF